MAGIKLLKTLGSEGLVARRLWSSGNSSSPYDQISSICLSQAGGDI
ncbi:uncharacterized protein RAG0_04364 [Rhynchosporium agropyri]|uniref:Uncharacterized protein n=1 Tax=Rhynchosporium agropyri TaxID=914238 RepID=A0A1E1K8E0_9HELO|nr:uncharacterized protein RAG0_04364 [Rhynchosporium agropyri]